MREMLSIPSRAKKSLISSSCVSEGMLPTHSANPDCFGFLGGPLAIPVISVFESPFDSGEAELELALVENGLVV
jgi:hypothetical protein